MESLSPYVLPPCPLLFCPEASVLRAPRLVYTLSPVSVLPLSHTRTRSTLSLLSLSYLLSQALVTSDLISIFVIFLVTVDSMATRNRPQLPGASMQQDLTDAVKWAVKEGFADEKRIAIMGGSYGGLCARALGSVGSWVSGWEGVGACACMCVCICMCIFLNLCPSCRCVQTLVHACKCEHLLEILWSLFSACLIRVDGYTYPPPLLPALFPLPPVPQVTPRWQGSPSRLRSTAAAWISSAQHTSRRFCSQSRPTGRP